MIEREIDAPAASVRQSAWILGGIGAGLSVVIALWWLREPETFIAQRLPTAMFCPVSSLMLA